ncbi:MAG: DNA internalization-related competence protein ComEC/Rec2 [Gammaproteobacteria bacterium]|nr:DNA internalization-related competence protein ComEC/Rec2 [Gammaproteobacteria bacterium]
MDARTRPAPVVADARLLIFAFTLGVLSVHALAELPPAPWLAALAVPALLPWRGRGYWAAAAFGVLFAVWRAAPVLAERWPEARHGDDVPVRGVVASLPEHGAQAWRFLLETDSPGIPRRIRVSWYRGAESIKAGECWRLVLRMRTPHGSLNPAGLDYEGWLFRQGIGATASVREGQPCGAADGYRVLRWRQALVDRLGQWLSGHPALGLLAALTVGDQGGITDAQWDSFRLTGTSHLIAISGFNVGIVAGLAFFLFRWAWSAWPRLCLWIPAQRVGLLGSAAAAVFYALLAGFEPPVQRAVAMLLAIVAAAWLHRLTEPSRVLALAWLAVLLLEPFAVLNPGLWLSFGAVAAIFYVSVGRVRPPGFWHAALFLQAMLAVALAPLCLYFFQGTSLLAPLVNLLAVPLFVVLTPAALAGIVLALAWPALGVPLLGAVAQVLQMFAAGLDLAASAAGLWLAASPPPAALILALIGVALLFAPRGVPVRPLAALCFVPLGFPPATAPREGFELTALDVGQGLAVVVRTAGHALLYDTGPSFEDGFDAGESVVAPNLLGSGLRELDLLLISHGDNDHAGGADAVRRRVPVRREVGAGLGEPCRAAMAWVWDGVRFEILHPDGQSWSDNDSSCVLRVAWNGHAALLAGDIEKKAEQRLLRDYAGRLPADVLIAPHHGSRTSSTAQFVDAVRPRVVVYGAGWRNHFGHPRPEVVRRYAALDAKQYVTGAAGAVTLRFAAGGVSAPVLWRREAAHFWNAPLEALPYNFVGLGASP